MSHIRTLRDAEQTHESNIDNAYIIHDAMLVQTALPVTQLALIVPQVSSAHHGRPLWRAPENVVVVVLDVVG